MNGRSIETFVLTWVYDRGKHKAVAFHEGTDLHNLARKNIEAIRLEVHVNDEGVANLSWLHTKQHRVQHAEGTAFP